MNKEKYIYFSIWFAWRPVRTSNKGWTWLKYVERVSDERDEIYLGLLPRIYYTAI